MHYLLWLNSEWSDLVDTQGFTSAAQSVGGSLDTRETLPADLSGYHGVLAFIDAGIDADAIAALAEVGSSGRVLLLAGEHPGYCDGCEPANQVLSRAGSDIRLALDDSAEESHCNGTETQQRDHRLLEGIGGSRRRTRCLSRETPRASRGPRTGQCSPSTGTSSSPATSRPSRTPTRVPSKTGRPSSRTCSPSAATSTTTACRTRGATART